VFSDARLHTDDGVPAPAYARQIGDLWRMSQRFSMTADDRRMAARASRRESGDPPHLLSLAHILLIISPESLRFPELFAVMLVAANAAASASNRRRASVSSNAPM